MSHRYGISMPCLVSLRDFSGPWGDHFWFWIKERYENLQQSRQKKGFQPSVALLFFEPSTRTFLSFDKAAGELGFIRFGFHDPKATSLEKGESIHDTVMNVLALEPSLLVIRAGDDAPFEEWKKLPIPLICAGWGKRAHPTQALLDSCVLLEYWGNLKGKNILFVGDGKYSRVLQSHREWLPALGARLGFFMPNFLLPDHIQSQSELVFEHLDDALKWCHAVIGLRYQKERWNDMKMEGKPFPSITLNDLEKAANQPLLLHPGPVGWGMEFDHSLKSYHRNLIFQQVTWGVKVRKVLLDWMISEKLN